MSDPQHKANHLELFKEAGEWAKASGRTITPDMADLLGWLTGAASAWAEQFATDKESLTVDCAPAAQVVDDGGPKWAEMRRDVPAGTLLYTKSSPSIVAPATVKDGM